MNKVPFSHDSKIHEVKVRKSYFAPFELIELLENLHTARTDLELSVCALVLLSQQNTTVATCRRAEKSFANFDSMWFQSAKKFEKFQTLFKSLGTALPTDLCQILLTQTQGYKIVCEDGKLSSNEFVEDIILQYLPIILNG